MGAACGVTPAIVIIQYVYAAVVVPVATTITAWVVKQGVAL